MTDRVEALTRELRATAGDLDGAAGRVRDVLTTLDASRTAHWGGWGNDEFGEHFSGGEGYLKADTNLVDAIESKIELLRVYANGLRDGATELDGMDTGNEREFGS